MAPAAAEAAAATCLPDAFSLDLHLAHPTPEEKMLTWRLNAADWGRALSLEAYTRREELMMDAPLARDGGITYWVLVDRNLPCDGRPILAYCETIRKRALVGRHGEVVEVVSHGVGSVFCNPKWRGRGYASRMMRDLGRILQTWQTDARACRFTVLWSDIGKGFYASHGWNPFPSTHIEFPAAAAVSARGESLARKLGLEDLEKLCEDDVALVRRTMANARDKKTHVAIVPDFEQIKWHLVREDFMCQHVLGRKPTVRGAVSGEPGHRIWATWSRTFYGPQDGTSSNTLHILRLVVEDEASHSSCGSFANGTAAAAQQPPLDHKHLERQAQHLRAVLEVAQTEAAGSQLPLVELWNPSPLVRALVEKSGLAHGVVEREKDSIPCLKWCGEGGGSTDAIEWVVNEKYAWN